MLELSGVKSGELIPANSLLMTWLQARQVTLSLQHAPTLHTLQAALKQPLEPDEPQRSKSMPNTLITSRQTVLTTARVQDLLNHIFLRRVERGGG